MAGLSKSSDFKIRKERILRLLKWLLMSIIILVPLLSQAKKQAHDFEGKCSSCHLSLADSKKIFVREIDFLCSGCHKEPGMSHPSGIKPSMSIPNKFPLDWAGRLTCSTCHDIHGNNAQLLRVEKPGRAFCHSCHKGLIEKHGGTDQPAHSGRSVNTMGFEVIEPSAPIDKLSKECLGCHDSILGSAADTRIGSGIWNHGNGVSHPIGTDYMKAYRKGRLKHPSSITPAIRLFNGRLGCGSCHNMYSRERKHLVISNKGSALCLSCHIV